MSTFGTRLAGAPVALVLLAPIGVAAQDLIFADGFESGTTAAWSATVPPPPTAFRATDLDLRDPHLFVTATPFCFDITDTGVPVLGVPSFNEQLATTISEDGDGDGNLDLSLMVLLRPLDPLSAGAALAELARGACSVPPGTVCGPQAGPPAPQSSYLGLAAGVCQEALPGSTSGYLPTPPSPLAPCMVTSPVDAAIDLGGTLVPLLDATLAATFTGEPPTGMVDGVLRGFLTEADADAVLIDPSIPVVGGQPLSSLLPGGAGCCAGHDDRDELDGVSGWWMYLELVAEVVPWSGP